VLNLNTNTEWKDIPEYNSLYEVSTEGNIRSKKSGKILRPYVRHGYACVSLCKKSKVKKFAVHRVVATVFIPNPESKPQVNHINGDKLINTAVNLEWVTCSENHKHAYTLGLKDPKTACPCIGNNKGTSSKYMYVTHSVTPTDDRYIAVVRVGTFKKTKSFNVKKFGAAAEKLAAVEVNNMIDTYVEFKDIPKNVF